MADHSPHTKRGRVGWNYELQQDYASRCDGLQKSYAKAPLGDDVAVPFEITLQAIANRDR